MEKRIELKGMNSISRLVGNEYGKQIFETQIAEHVDLSSNNIIVFPKTIEGVAISLIEGMLSMLPKEISRKDFYKYFSIEGKDSVINKFFDVVMMGQ